VNFDAGDGVNSVTGTITTNGHFGALSSTDITGWNLVIHTGPVSEISIGANPSITGVPLEASSTVIDFEPANGSVSFINGISFWQLLGTSLIPPNGGMVFFNDFLHNNTVPFLSPTRDLPIAIAELTPPATTPLPAALPMFMGGAGLIGLLSRCRKKKSTALAA
jgi:hypothetical protein